ncbi:MULTISPECIES: M48 family metallopeptidase [Psychrobacter]|uniref:M48 family metallopeptidase n=1 Tax=Psychrobacter TaxID=497 RepID=UPI000EBD7ABC|nr:MULTISPECIES: SprT family zinc-dependent metalloprotease [Psychrobacter]HCH26245.1 metal-dependent hydrolase [Psychrobacter sp.]
MQLMIGSLDIQLQRKTIKHLHISVMPPNGEIRVAAPEAMTETAIRMAVIHRIPWIRKQQASFIKQARQSTREMIDGETHYLWGRRYRLEVLKLDTTQNPAPSIKLKGGKLILSVHTKTSTTDRLKLLNEYYRTRLKARIPALITQWSEKFNVTVTSWQVQKMKTKWGSCNIEEGRILLNLELAKKPVPCLEYIIVHELLHFKERQHNDRFKALLDTQMPDWRSRRDLLNRMPLGQENWKQREQLT